MKNIICFFFLFINLQFTFANPNVIVNCNDFEINNYVSENIATELLEKSNWSAYFDFNSCPQGSLISGYNQHVTGCAMISRVYSLGLNNYCTPSSLTNEADDYVLTILPDTSGFSLNSTKSILVDIGLGENGKVTDFEFDFFGPGSHLSPDSLGLILYDNLGFMQDLVYIDVNNSGWQHYVVGFSASLASTNWTVKIVPYGVEDRTLPYTQTWAKFDNFTTRGECGNTCPNSWWTGNTSFLEPTVCMNGGIKHGVIYEIFDECLHQITYPVYWILVIDDSPPTIECKNVITLVANEDCLATWKIDATHYDNCTDTKLSAYFHYHHYDEGDSIQLGCGEHIIELTSRDQCGNESSCVTTIFVADNISPVGICDASAVSLGNDFVEVPAITFDDGSHDNCGTVSFKARKMLDVCNNKTIATEYLTFCCEEANTEVMVALEVTDKSGNITTCMTSIEIQYKPELICPIGRTINCGVDYTTIDLGEPLGNICHLGIERTFNTKNLNSCGSGLLEVQYTILDGVLEPLSCVQEVHIEHETAFQPGDIDFPWDVEFEFCDDELHLLAPNLLENEYGYPIIKSQSSCLDYKISYDDDIFNFGQDGACKKIIRTWTVFECCSGTRLEHKQLLKIVDKVYPEIAFLPLDTICSYQDCGTIQLDLDLTDHIYVTDNCDNVSISHIKNGTEVDGTNISGLYHFGRNDVQFAVTDKCGNRTERIFSFVVKDCKAPVVYCYNGLSLSVGSSGEVEIWPSDFDAGSSDNCTDQMDLLFSFSLDPNDIHLSFTCDDIGSNPLEVWVTDECGNQSYCTTFVTITDSQNICGPGVGSRMVYGSIMDPDLEYHIKDVLIETDNSQHVCNDGHYSMTLDQNDFCLSATKDDDYLNGVSTLDLIMIQRHILGIEELTGHQLIAADINNDGNISGLDLIELRKLILGIYSELPENDSWKVYAIEGNRYIQKYNFTQQDSQHVNFVGIKIGDVNNSVEHVSNSVATYSLSYVDSDISLLFDQKIVAIEGTYKGDPSKIPTNTVNSITKNGYTSFLYTFEATNEFKLPVNATNIQIHSIVDINAKEYTVVNEKVESSIVLYPNPATSYVIIEGYSDTTVKIYDKDGIMISKRAITNSSLNISDLNPGMYMIQFNKGVTKPLLKL